jgi:hypothetical protein
MSCCARLVDAQAAAALSGPPLWVLVTDTAPQDAYVAVQYDSRWFWTADTDIQSKNAFAIICCCFRLPITRVKGVGSRSHDTRPASVIQDRSHEDKAHHIS